VEATDSKGGVPKQFEHGVLEGTSALLAESFENRVGYGGGERLVACAWF
jgi:hypothetical protein